MLEYAKIYVEFYDGKKQIYVSDAKIKIESGLCSIYTKSNDYYFRMCDVKCITCNNYDIQGFNVKN